mmetsp:Transcript_1104/g.4100  ORF Transcript_1104/g.4100 Transcript_1104/m.4100 type:complete len:210 (+) Transcript_1104:1339-1968(+)
MQISPSSPTARSWPLYVSPITCLISFSFASLSMYFSASNFGLIASAKMTVYLSRFSASSRKVRSSIARWCPERRFCTTADESLATSTSRRESWSRDMSILMRSRMASMRSPYEMHPSSSKCTPKFSICVMPSSFSKKISASKLTYDVSSKSTRLTPVRPCDSPRNCVESGSSSRLAVKKPPCTRSLLPSLSFNATIWFPPIGTHSSTHK